MPKWLFYCILADAIWGVWGIIPKIAADAPYEMQVICTLGVVPVSLLFLFSKNLRKGNNRPRGSVFAFLTGLCGGISNLLLLKAFKEGGEASTVLSLVTMYPLVTVILAGVLLKERPNAVQGMGFLVALVALYLFGAVSARDMGATADAGASSGWSRMISPWMMYSLVALVLLGISGITQKVATNHISSELSTVCFAAAFIPIAGYILVTQPLNWTIAGRDGFLYALYGVLIGFGMITQFAAYLRGKASVVTAVAALYPVVTFVLAVTPLYPRMAGVFGVHREAESLYLLKGVAIALALASGVALSYERSSKAAEPAPRKEPALS